MSGARVKCASARLGEVPEVGKANVAGWCVVVWRSPSSTLARKW